MIQSSSGSSDECRTAPSGCQPSDQANRLVDVISFTESQRFILKMCPYVLFHHTLYDLIILNFDFILKTCYELQTIAYIVSSIPQIIQGEGARLF